MSYGENLSASHAGPIERYPIKPESEIIFGGLEADSLKTEVLEKESPNSLLELNMLFDDHVLEKLEEELKIESVIQPGPNLPR